MKLCKSCGVKQSERGAFYWIMASNGKKYPVSECKRCFNIRCNKNGRAKKRQRVRENMSYAIDKLGGVCAQCGLDNPATLVFHHVVPRNGDGTLTISKLKNYTGQNGRKRLDDELKKCVLLCSNCHLSLHKQLGTYSEAGEKGAAIVHSQKVPSRNSM